MAVAHGEQTEHLTIVYEPTDEGWVAAQIEQVPAAISQGRSHEEARANVIDALHDLLDQRSRPSDPLRLLRVRADDAVGRLLKLVSR